MSSERPDEFDEIPSLQALPPGPGDDADGRDDPDRGLPRDDFDRPPPPPRKRGFGFWWAVLWSVLYFGVTQFVAGIFFGIPILLIALGIEVARKGNDALKPENLNAWQQSESFSVAILVLVAVTQVTGLALSWLLFRMNVGREWKRKIALTRGPTATHFALVVVGMPAMLALASAVDLVIQRFVPSLQQMLDALGFKFPGMEGTDEMIGKLVGQSPWALALFVVGVTPAICEEVFCRGFLGWGLSYRYRNWMVVLIVSFLFGCLHGDPRQGLGAMCLGAAIHGSYLATRSLWVPMFVHWANNSIGVIHLHPRLYPVLDPYERLLTESHLSAILFLTTAIFLFVAVAYALYQTRCKLVAVDARPAWQPDSPRGMEVPPPYSGTIVTHDALSPVSVALILTGAVAFGLVLALA